MDSQEKDESVGSKAIEDLNDYKCNDRRVDNVEDVNEFVAPIALANDVVVEDRVEEVSESDGRPQATFECKHCLSETTVSLEDTLLQYNRFVDKYLIGLIEDEVKSRTNQQKIEELVTTEVQQSLDPFPSDEPIAGPSGLRLMTPIVEPIPKRGIKRGRKSFVELGWSEETIVDHKRKLNREAQQRRRQRLKQAQTLT